MKKYFLSWMSIMMMALVCVGFSACGGDGDDDDGGGSGDINVKALVGSSWYKSETYAGGENVETKKYSLSFKTEYFATVQVSGNGDDADGHYRWDYGEKDCPFTISGNVMTIEYKGDHDYQETLKVTFKNNKPVGWTGGGGNSSATSDGNDTPTSAGTAAMFGYYFPQQVKDYGKQYADKGLPESVDIEGTRGWRIVDGSSIHVVEVGAMGSDPTQKGYNCTILAKDNTPNGRGAVYYYSFLYAKEEYRYVMKGSTIQLSNGKSLEYSNGMLKEDNYVYVKLK